MARHNETKTSIASSAPKHSCFILVKTGFEHLQALFSTGIRPTRHICRQILDTVLVPSCCINPQNTALLRLFGLLFLSGEYVFYRSVLITFIFFFVFFFVYHTCSRLEFSRSSTVPSPNATVRTNFFPLRQGRGFCRLSTHVSL